MHLYRDKALPGSENPSDEALSSGGIVSCTLKRMQPTILNVLCMNACNSCDSTMCFSGLTSTSTAFKALKPFMCVCFTFQNVHLLQIGHVALMRFQCLFFCLFVFKKTPGHTVKWQCSILLIVLADDDYSGTENEELMTRTMGTIYRCAVRALIGVFLHTNIKIL